MADRAQLELCITNLALNARDAMPGGGALTVAVRPLQLPQDRAGALRVAPGGYAAVEVRDSGLGMDEQVRAHLFEPFFTTKEKGKGTGLGLATCYGIVKQMGGHIWLEGRPGGGTTVEILLPRAEGTLEHPGAPEAGRADSEDESKAILINQVTIYTQTS